VTQGETKLTGKLFFSAHPRVSFTVKNNFGPRTNLFFNLSLDGELKSDKEEMSSSSPSPFLSAMGKLMLLTDDTSDKRRSLNGDDDFGMS
jgi:hypothetical protein